MLLQRPVRRRKGATAVESAIVLLVFMVLVLGMLDLSLAGFRYHLVAHAAREGARNAIVHGSLAPSSLGSWGPATISGTGASSGAFFDALRPYLVGLDNPHTSITAEWTDGSNDRGKRVRVTVTASYQPFLVAVFGTQPFTLRGVSTAVIAH